jgi:hypothetical protein
MRHLIACAMAALRFRDYRPQGVEFQRCKKWLEQFEKPDRLAVAALLSKIVYFSESQTRKALIDQNDVLLRKLKLAGLRFRNVIYVQLHDAGSSSPAMVNMLRDGARLERLGCHFIDSRDVLGLNHLSNKLGEGAIVYVDDFVGTADQFCESREFMIQNVVGNFAEFLLAPCICEEAHYRLAQLGVEVYAEKIHVRADRPLHDNCTILEPEVKERLRSLCLQIDKKSALGYKALASMVVFYRNAPDTIPVLLRGSVDQKPYVGIFPRISDLPKRIIG